MATREQVLNAVVWWNSLYLDAAVIRLRSDGFPATEALRPLRDPEQSD